VIYGIAPALAVLGLQLHSHGLINAATTVQEKGPLFGIASGIVLLMGATMLVGPRLLRQIYWAMFIPAFIATPILLGVILYTTSHLDFVNSFNHSMQWLTHNPNTYNEILSGAAKAGYVPHSATFAGTLAAIPVGFYLYAGFNDSVYFGGEIKQARRNQPRAIFWGLGITLVIYLLIVTRYQTVLGRNFVGASANYSTPLPSGALINFFMGTTQGGIWNWILGIGFTLWVLMLVGVMIMIPIRCMFAWSMDRVIPNLFSAVTSNGTPWVSTVFSLVVGIIFVAIYNYTSFYTLLANVTVISLVVWAMAGLSGALFPYVKKDLFGQTPDFVQRRVLGIPLITICGVLLVCLHIGILYYSFKTPAFSGPVSWRSILFCVLVFAVPFAGYFVSRAIRSREGIDLGLAFSEIPPE
jgi:amino acid transporter